MAKIKKIFFPAFAGVCLVGAIYFGWMFTQRVTPIIMYHSVNYVSKPTANVVSPERFAWHMDFLQNNGYRVVSLSELVKEKAQGRKLPAKTVVITFDDGYEDNYTHAYPVLKKHHFPATIFMPSGEAGHAQSLSWRQMREMIKNGITIGSHTINQAYLPDLSADEQKRQIIESKKALEQNLNVPIYYFAYPSGGFSKSIENILKEAGYKGACATNRGFDKSNNNVFELNRVRLSDKDNSAPILWFKLSGLYNIFREPKNPY